VRATLSNQAERIERRVIPRTSEKSPLQEDTAAQRHGVSLWTLRSRIKKLGIA